MLCRYMLVSSRFEYVFADYYAIIWVFLFPIIILPFCVTFLCSFPKDIACQNAWIKAIRRQDAVTKKPWQPQAADVVCSEHFRPTDLVTNRGNTLLKASAVPVIQLPPHLVSCTMKVTFGIWNRNGSDAKVCLTITSWVTCDINVCSGTMSLV